MSMMERAIEKSAEATARLIDSSKPWSPPPLPLSPHFVLHTLLLIHTPLKALSFFTWAQSNGFSHTHHSYSLILHKLCHGRHLDAARDLLFSMAKSTGGAIPLSDRFFNILIRGYGHAGLLTRSMSLFSAMKRAGVSPSIFTLNSLLHLLLRRGNTAMAKSLYYKMLSTYYLRPDTYTFNILIRGFCLKSMLDDALRFFRKMPFFGCHPDIVTYNTLVDGMCRCGTPERAHSLLQTMWDGGKGFSPLPDVATYTSLIRGYCRKNAVADALSIYHEMLKKGIRPNNITMNTLLQGLSESRELDKMKEVMMMYEDDNELSPDTCTFNTLINAHCEEGRVREAMALFSKMSSLHVAPDSATYSTLVRCLCEGGEEARAEQLLDEMMKKKILRRGSGCRPIPEAFSSILKHLCATGKTLKAEAVLIEMMRRGVPDAASFEILIMGHCREGRPKSGYKLLSLMLRHGCRPPRIELYECLVGGLLGNERDEVMAYKTAMKMPKGGGVVKVMHGVLSALVGGGRARESGEVVREMLERKVRQNMRLSTETVKLLAEKGMVGEAMRTVRLLYEGGFRVREEEVAEVLLQRGDAGEAWEVVLLGRRKEKVLDGGICERVVEEMCRRGMAEKAFSVFYELVEMGVRLPHPYLAAASLVSLLLSKRKRREAEFVRKRMGPC